VSLESRLAVSPWMFAASVAVASGTVATVASAQVHDDSLRGREATATATAATTTRAPLAETSNSGGGEHVLPTSWTLSTPDHLRIGVLLEQSLINRDLISTTAVGVSVNYRNRWLSPNLRLAIRPAQSIEDTYAAFGGGVRAYFRLLGAELSYGLGAQIETRLEDHFWLAWATPVELGATLYEEGSWRIGLFAGFSRTFGGALINNFLVDPNGFDDEGAQENLQRIRSDGTQTFLRIVFARKI
jgi:hypothetical protein